MLAAAALAPAGATQAGRAKGPVQAMKPGTDATREIWVDLSEPPLASARGATPAQREALRQRIEAQQDEVAAALRELGAVETGRVQLLRNAIAVRIAAGRIARVKLISGVIGVRVVRHLEYSPPPPQD